MDEQRKSIEQLLRSYLEKRSRMRFIELDIEGLRNMLTYANQPTNESKDEAIAGMSLHASVISDMPMGGSKEYQSSTERVALTIDNQHDNEFDIDEIYSKIAQLTREYNTLSVDVRKVDIFLDSLTEKERMICEKFYINAWTWTEIEILYANQMPTPRDKHRLLQYRTQLIEKIKRVSA